METKLIILKKKNTLLALVKFKSIIFKWCRFKRNEVQILIKANLRGVDLRGADLTRAILMGADLTDANLRYRKFKR